MVKTSKGWCLTPAPDSAFSCHFGWLVGRIGQRWRNVCLSTDLWHCVSWFVKRNWPFWRRTKPTCPQLSWGSWIVTSRPRRREENPRHLPGLEGRSKDPLAKAVGPNPASPGRKIVSHKPLWAIAGENKVNELGSSKSPQAPGAQATGRSRLGANTCVGKMNLLPKPSG
jgi:hypothetical protein